jgi:predicted dehydrogenase
MPRRVRGFCQLGRWHEIEVEDDATAWFEWDHEATGVFIGSTGESPGTNRLEIAGTLGRLVLEHDRLSVDRNDTDAMEFCRQTKEGFSKLAVKHSEVKVEGAEAPHVAILQNFVNAILDGEPLIAPGAEGLNSLELANAIVFSSLLGQTVELPMDCAAWKAKLDELISHSTFKKKVVTDSTGDVASSFQG